MEQKYCCDVMKSKVFLIDEFNLIKNAIDEGKSVVFFPKFREYGLPYIEDSVSVDLIEYCPWCGKELPKSMRDEWFFELGKLGIDDPLSSKKIPKRFMTSEWYDENKEYSENDNGFLETRK